MNKSSYNTFVVSDLRTMLHNKVRTIQHGMLTLEMKNQLNYASNLN